MFWPYDSNGQWADGGYVWPSARCCARSPVLQPGPLPDFEGPGRVRAESYGSSGASSPPEQIFPGSRWQFQNIVIFEFWSCCIFVYLCILLHFCFPFASLRILLYIVQDCSHNYFWALPKWVAEIASNCRIHLYYVYIYRVFVRLWGCMQEVRAQCSRA